MPKDWRILPTAPDEFIDSLSDYDPIIAQLLYNRGLRSQQDIDLFFNPEYSRLFDPFVFGDMKSAVARIEQAILNQEKIMIHGDYDADGVTSSAVLFRALRAFGANVEVFIPHRELDGYGMNMRNVELFISQGVKLLITVDCGITNVPEIARLTEAGVDTIVTDHHEPPAILPVAVALLDPKVADSGYPFPELAGAGVAFKLVQALLKNEVLVENGRQEIAKYGGVEGFEKWLLDIVAIGTVADVAPLISENRILVKWGLVVLEKTRNLGLQKLLDLISNKKIDTYTIGYQIAPRLNAAGRMKHASAAFELLVADNEADAARLAGDLQKNNQDRQQITEGAVDIARQQFLLLDREQEVLFAYHEDWAPGIIGLIAGKLSEEFYRPVVVMTDSNGAVVGSGRSIEGFNITNGLVVVQHLLSRFGGHSQACGFTLNSLEVMADFQSGMLVKAKEEFAGNLPSPFIEADAELQYSEINWPILEQLDRFEPFGEGNLKPRFILRDLELVSADTIGADSQHFRLQVKQGTPKIFKMMLFGRARDWKDELQLGITFDAICEIDKNEWNGNREIQCKIIDLKVKK